MVCVTTIKKNDQTYWLSIVRITIDFSLKVSNTFVYDNILVCGQ